MGTEGNSLPSQSCPDGGKRRVCYYYDPGIANVDYGPQHVMVPRRVAMTHGLVASYGLLGEMRRLRTRPATEEEMRAILDVDYVDLLRGLTPDKYRTDAAIQEDARDRCIGVLTTGPQNSDNPVIDGLWDYCLRYAGGSLAAARALGSGSSDIAINWSGGMHHACREKASGFCYVNDIVLAIEELLKHFARVLYLDIDVHHGDGVENYYKENSRVMAVSFHRYGDDGSPTDKFFPGTGSAEDVGEGEGKYRTLNVPMKAGMDDDGYHELFTPITDKVMEVFRPDAIVLQCGADSLSGDKLGGFNLSVKGHAKCVSYIRSFNKPLLLLGGGGYTINHVASCWCYETAVALGKQEISNDIPHHGYEHYYKDQGYKLHYTETQVVKSGCNSKVLNNVRMDALKNLKKLSDLKLQAAPSVQITAGGSIDVEDLYERPKRSRGNDPKERERLRRRKDKDDPMERLHRLCGDVDLRKEKDDPMERLHRLCGEKDLGNCRTLFEKRYISKSQLFRI